MPLADRVYDNCTAVGEVANCAAAAAAAVVVNQHWMSAQWGDNRVSVLLCVSFFYKYSSSDRLSQPHYSPSPSLTFPFNIFFSSFLLQGCFALCFCYLCCRLSAAQQAFSLETYKAKQRQKQAVQHWWTAVVDRKRRGRRRRRKRPVFDSAKSTCLRAEQKCTGKHWFAFLQHTLTTAFWSLFDVAWFLIFFVTVTISYRKLAFLLYKQSSPPSIDRVDGNMIFWSIFNLNLKVFIDWLRQCELS